MTINEALVDLINNTQNKFYLYVSNSDENLNQAMNHCLVSIDLGNTTTRPIFVRPEGVPLVEQTVSGIFCERGIAMPPQPRKLALDAAFAWVDPETKEVIL
jgi:hypothetical protein